MIQAKEFILGLRMHVTTPNKIFELTSYLCDEKKGPKVEIRSVMLCRDPCWVKSSLAVCFTWMDNAMKNF
jgi:hypothetical protein